MRQRKRETAHSDHVNPSFESGRSIILGWQSKRSAKIGFGKQLSPTTQDQNPVTYAGDSHLITIAPTGAGKGRGVIIPNLLTYNGPVVVFDPKGENYITTARRRREMGQQVVKLDPFGVVDGESDSFNPLDIFNLQNVDLESDAQMLAELLSRGVTGFKEPFWDVSGSALQSGVIAHVATMEEEKRQLSSVRDLLMADDTVYSLAVVLDTVGKTMNKMAHDEIAAFLQMPELTRGGVLATANSYLKSILSDRVIRTLQQSSFNLQDVVDGKPLSIYLIIPPDKLQSHRAVVKLWVGALLKAITSRQSIPEQKTLFMLDECGQLQHFPFLETIITLCRGYGALCWTFWQDLAQLQHWYPTSWKTILNNCGVIQTFGINNRDMATQWSGYLDHGPSQLRGLRSNQQVLSIHGRREQVSTLFDYLSDAPFIGRFDDNRLFRSVIQRDKLCRTANDESLCDAESKPVSQLL